MTVQSMRPELSEADIIRLMKGETSEERATVAHRLCRRIAVDVLSDDERQKIRQWIAEGAELPGAEEVVSLATDHWSFQPVAGEHRHGSVDKYLRESLGRKGLQF